MLFWLLGILLMGGLGAAGRAVGATRYAVILLGLWISHFVAVGLDAKLIDWMLNKEGKLANPLLNWVLPSVILYAASAVVFIIIAQVVYTKVLVFYKYKMPDERRVSWDRMDRGVGIPLGVAVGATLLIELGILIHAVGYWTVQLEASSPEENPPLVKIFNPLKKGLHGSGLEPMVLSLDPCPDLFYDIADTVGVVYNNPDTKLRLTTYPGTLTLAEQDVFKAISADEGIQLAIDGQKNFEALISGPLISNPVLYSPAVRSTLFNLDWKDLRAYLETGESPKYKDEKLLGKWNIFVAGTRVRINDHFEDDDKTAILTLEKIRRQFPVIVRELQFLAAGDGSAMLKGRITSIGDVKSLIEGKPLQAPSGKAPEAPVIILSGTWESTDGSYTVNWENDHGSGECEIQEDKGTVTVPLGAGTLVLRR